MKKFRRYIILFVLAIDSLSVQSIEIDVRFVEGDVPDTLQTMIIRNFSFFLSTISPSCKDTVLIPYSNNKAINQNVLKFMESNTIICENIDAIYRCYKTKSGFEIRDVNVIVVQGDSINVERKLTIVFTMDGEVSDIFYSIDDGLYRNIFNNSPVLNPEEDSISNTGSHYMVDDKTAIVNFIEQYQTSFENKDMVFIEKLFSEDALIITGGNVIRYKSNNVYQGDLETNYLKQNKADYLTLIKRDMLRNEKTKIHISDIEIVQHPSNKKIYGVTIVQQYKSGNHSDNSKLFLLVDASKENLKILKRVFLPKERSIDIRDFHIK